MYNSVGFLSVSEGSKMANSNYIDYYIHVNVIERYTILYKTCSVEFSVSSGPQIMWSASLNSEIYFRQ